MDQVILPRSGTAPLRFRGELLAQSSSRKDGLKKSARQWYEAFLYRIDGGGFVASAVYRTEWAHEREHSWAVALTDAQEVICWLQNLPVLDAMIGCPPGEQFERKQERLAATLRSQWEWLVGDLLAKAGEAFAATEDEPETDQPITADEVRAAVTQLAKSRKGMAALQSLRTWLDDGDGLSLDGANQDAVFTLLEAAWGGMAGTVLDAMNE